MLEKERFLAIKKLANKIRKDNEDLFKALENVTPEEAIREKEEFIEKIIDSMGIRFEDGEQGREERQIFRANILLPNDDAFYKEYSKDKNIRNLMNKFAVGIEDIMSKITELNVYGKYEEEPDFVNEMMDVSSKDAESLLEEIEDLSSVMAGLNLDNITDEDLPEIPSIPEDNIKEEPKEEKKIMKPEVISEDEEEEEPDLEDMSSVVTGFVDEYNNLQETLDKSKAELEAAMKKMDKLQKENETLKQNNLEAVNALNSEKDAKNRLEAEVLKLKDRNKLLEDKLRQSVALFKRLYNSIPRKK